MHILVLQETDWLTRGPNTQHHVFERLSRNPSIKITVVDYDIDKIQLTNSKIIKKQIYKNINRSIKNSKVKIIRTAHIQIPYFRRISSLITNFIEIIRFIRKNRPEIIIGFSISNGLIGLILGKLFNIPYIFYYIDLLHTLVPFPFAENLARKISRFILINSDQVIVVTKLLQNFVINEGISPKRVKILLNGISLENTLIDKKKLDDLKSTLSISNDDFVIFFMGILYEFAGLKEIIDYYDPYIKNGKFNLKFLILGDSGIYNYLKSYVKKIGADWVILIGRVPFFDITEYIELADLCLLSFKKNKITNRITPIKIMEYMSMKKPVLSNSLPNVVLEIGKQNGIIYTKNQKELIKKIGDLSFHKKELKNLGNKGFNFILKNYLWSNILKDFKKIMLRIITKKMNKIYLDKG